MLRKLPLWVTLTSARYWTFTSDQSRYDPCHWVVYHQEESEIIDEYANNLVKDLDKKKGQCLPS